MPLQTFFHHNLKKTMPDCAFRIDLCSHYKDLQTYARSLEPDTEDANDLVQETLYKAMRYREKFNTAMSLRGWLFTILKNTRVNAFRRKKFSNNLIAGEETLSYTKLYYSASKNDGERNCVMSDIQRSISELNPEYGLAISYFLTGYKYHEISTMLNIPIGTVKFRIHMARGILKEKLSVYHPH
ncbi:MAG: RNA polymerase sigma factor [Bacteroidota bacterium]